jgi:hypothetical protein
MGGWGAVWIVVEMIWAMMKNGVRKRVGGFKYDEQHPGYEF